MDAPKERPIVPPHVPPPLPPRVTGALNYARPGGVRPDVRDLPVAAGFFLGIALYVTVAAAWWGIVRAGGGLSVALWGLAGVPATAMLSAVVLEATLGWRGIRAGAATALGLSFLIGCFGIAAICGKI